MSLKHTRHAAFDKRRMNFFFFSIGLVQSKTRETCSEVSTFMSLDYRKFNSSHVIKKKEDIPQSIVSLGY